MYFRNQYQYPSLQWWKYENISVHIKKSEVKIHVSWYVTNEIPTKQTDWLHATGTRLADKSKSKVCKGTSVHMLIYNTSLRSRYNKATGGRMSARAVTTWLTRGWGKKYRQRSVLQATEYSEPQWMYSSVHNLAVKCTVLFLFQFIFILLISCFIGFFFPKRQKMVKIMTSISFTSRGRPICLFAFNSSD
jgi:hypothetical protein